jgi:acyl carrier protein phosphodiesterase
MIRDGSWTLYDHDFQTGRSVWHLFDGEKDVFRVDYPVDTLMSENAAVRNCAEKAWRGDWHRVASIPLNVAHDSGLVEAHSQGDDRFVKRFLNSSDNRAWRTKEGAL